jgi:TonB family protein
MMRRALAALLFTLAAAGACAGQTPAPKPKPAQPKPAPSGAEAARQEINLGARLYRAGRFAEAEQHFRRALELDPEGKDTRLFIARAIHQQYKPGVQTPENLAAGERAAAAYQEILQRDPANDDAYKAAVFIYEQIKQEDKLCELLLWRANDFSMPNAKRADAFTLLAGKQWNCSHEITERPGSKKTAEGPAGAATVYTPPADMGDLIRARQCVSDGMQFVEQAIGLDPKHQSALSFKANLLREAAKLAEMEGNAAQKAEYERLFKEAMEAAGRKAELGGQQEGVAAGVSMPPAQKGVVSGGVLNGKAVSKPQPEYPEIAKAARASGTVTVQVLVDEGGNVVSATAVSGHPLLQQAAVQAARAAKFSPTLLSGQPVKVSGVVTYNFVLQ